LPSFQLFDADTDIRAGYPDRLRDLVRMQWLVGQEEKRIDLTNRAIDAPATTHLAEVSDESVDGWGHDLFEFSVNSEFYMALIRINRRVGRLLARMLDGLRPETLHRSV
jgi:hypothetical protein